MHSVLVPDLVQRIGNTEGDFHVSCSSKSTLVSVSVRVINLLTMCFTNLKTEEFLKTDIFLVDLSICICLLNIFCMGACCIMVVLVLDYRS